MRSERCRTWAISWSSSMTSTRTGRSEASIPLMLGREAPQSGNFYPRVRRQGAAARRRRGSSPDAARPPPPQVQARSPSRGRRRAPGARPRRCSSRSSSSATTTSSGSASSRPRSSSPSSSTSTGTAGRRATRAVDGMKLRHRRRALPRPDRADGGRRDPRAAPGAARRAAVQDRRDLPVRRARARLRGRHARARPRRRAHLLGARVDQAARRLRGGGALLRHLDLPRHARRPHDRALPASPPRCCCSPARRWRASSSSRATPSTTTSREVRSKVQKRRPATEELSALEQGPPPRVTAVARTFPEDEETLPDVLGEAVDLEPTVEDLRDEVPQLEELAEDPETDEPGVARTTPNRRGPHAPGPLPRLGDRLARVRVDAARPRLPQALDRRARASPTPPGRRRSPPS